MAIKQNKAFTIMELLVAIALLVILVALSSAVFTTTVKAHRKATASIEITRNLRVLTDQLNTDFQGLRKDAPLMFWFDAVGNDDDGSGTVESDEYAYYDMIHFFADGDFQTMRQYDSDGDGTDDKTVVGNLARIYYGHANSADQMAGPGTEDFDTYRLLARKSHVLTADADIFAVYDYIPRLTSLAGGFGYEYFDSYFGNTTHSGNTYIDENQLEFSTLTLTQWMTALHYLDAGNPDNADAFIAGCMDDDSRPFVDLGEFETLHLLMAQGVSDFHVQWAYTNDDLLDASGVVPTPALFTGIRWWPSVDPAGDMSVASDFTAANSGNPFGVYLTLPNGTNEADWLAIQDCQTGSVSFADTFYPKALKFTFTLHDSNGMFEDGKTFTHIVYLD